MCWQCWPAYLLAVAAGFFPVRFPKARIAVLGVLCAVSVAAWSILPVPWLTKPDGPHKIGTSTFRWVDELRPEEATGDPNDKRNVIVQAFYPAAKGASGAHSIYMDGLQNRPAYVSILPRFSTPEFR